MMPLSVVSAYVGGVSLICTLVILNIFLVMSGVVQERKDKVLLFVLSLPVSTTQYMVAKVVANAIAFVVPWLVLTIAAVGVIDATRDPERHAAVLAGRPRLSAALLLRAAGSRARHGLDGLARDGDHDRQHLGQLPDPVPARRFPRSSRTATAPTAVWTADIVAILALEIAAGAAALGLAIYVVSRRTDFV